MGLSLFWWVALPLAELFICREFFHTQFGPGNIVLGAETFDVLIPGTMGISLFLWLLSEKDPVPWVVRKSFLIVHLFFLVLLLSLLSVPRELTGTFGYALYGGIIFGLGCLVLLSCFGISFPGKYFHEITLRNPQLFFTFLLTLWTLVGYHKIVKSLWRPVSRLTGNAVCHSLSTLGMQVHCTLRDHVDIVHPLFSASIAWPCSGLEGVFFFLFTFSILLMFEQRKIGFFRTCLHYLLGIGMMLILNVIRISIFFVAATRAVQYWGRAKAQDYFIGAFHNHIGWIIYFIGIGTFVWIYTRKNRESIGTSLED